MENKVLRVIESYDIANSQNTIELAKDLARFIKENKLFSNIQGKAFVNVEGWQYAGARLGIVPIVREVEKIPDGALVKYYSRVELLNLRTDTIIGCGFAICANNEAGKKHFQEYAIASMAQTRAIGKAYRNILAWIIRAAGYEPTPAEEMDYEIQETNKVIVDNQTGEVLNAEDLKSLIHQINKVEKITKLAEIWNANPGYQNEPSFKKAMADRKKALKPVAA